MVVFCRVCKIQNQSNYLQQKQTKQVADFHNISASLLACSLSCIRESQRCQPLALARRLACRSLFSPEQCCSCCPNVSAVSGVCKPFAASLASYFARYAPSSLVLSRQLAFHPYAPSFNLCNLRLVGFATISSVLNLPYLIEINHII